MIAGACAFLFALCLSFPILSFGAFTCSLRMYWCSGIWNQTIFDLPIFENFPVFRKALLAQYFAHCKIYPILRQSFLFLKWECMGLWIFLFCFLMFSTSIFNFQLLICQKILFHVVIRISTIGLRIIIFVLYILSDSRRFFNVMFCERETFCWQSLMSHTKVYACCNCLGRKGLHDSYLFKCKTWKWLKFNFLKLITDTIRSYLCPSR